VYRRLSLGVLLLACACRTPTGVSGGPPKPGPIPSQGCDGKAPLDPALKGIAGLRASWFNDPSGNERLYVLEAGPPAAQTKGPPLVLIHGVGAIGTGDYYPVLGQLSLNRHILAVDLPGFGRSNPEDRDFGPERLARSVDTVVRACAPGKIDVLGHSSGGSLAVLFAAKRKDVVRRLVLVDVAGILRPEVLLHGQLHQSLTPMREKVPVISKVVEKTGSVLIDAIQALVPNAEKVAETGLLGKSPGVLAATSLLDFNFGRAIAEVEAPTMILWGQKDYVVPTRIAQLLDDRIARSELVFIPDSGHVPMKDQPGSMSLLVAKYLDGPEPPENEPTSPPPLSTTRDGLCKDQEDLTLTGDYDEILVTDCIRFRLHNVRANQITVRKSEGRIDDSTVGRGLFVYDSDLFITGGELKGPVALESSDSKLDIAGVDITGTQAAIRARKKSDIVLSVTPVHSPKTDEMVHKELELHEGQEL
jgi:pimeloyl-ACP methyl ester carboxylesterase